MIITNEFTVPLNPDETWKVLLDIKRIVPCVPGAELLDVVDDQTYKGKVSIKLGPVSLAFIGTAKFDEVNEAAKTAKVLAKGSDAKGRGGANSVVELRLEPVEDGTKVVVETNVNLSGSVAQYGRGTGVIQGVASQITAQFAQNLKAMLARRDDEEEAVPVAAPAPSGPAVSDATTGDGIPAALGAGFAAPAPGPASLLISSPDSELAPRPEQASASMLTVRTEAAAARAEAAAARIEAAVARVEAAVARAEASPAAAKKADRAPPLPAFQAKPISGLSLMSSVLWGMVTGAFSRRKPE